MSIGTFLITSLIIILIPGTGVIYTISVGMMKGRERSIIAALGCTMGIIPHLCLSIALSSLLMQMNSAMFMILKYAGVIYLIYMGIGMIISKEKMQFNQESVEEKGLNIKS